MIEVTQADREAAANLFGGTPWSYSQFISGKRDKTDKVQAFAAHRIAAEKASDVALATAYQCGHDVGEERATKAVLDRLRNLPDDVALAAIARVPDYEGTHRTARYVQNTATALADALETK